MSNPFDYDNINLIPKKCIVDSRSQCQTHIQLGDHYFEMPIVPANMECVMNEDLAKQLAKSGYFYILHRFKVNIPSFIQTMKAEQLITSISIGVNDDSYILLEDLVKQDLIPNYITIDIAHGHSIKMQIMINFIRSHLKFKHCFLICGNVSTREAVRDLVDWGANCIKVGIGPGSACTTYPTTGFGSRDIQAYIVRECVVEGLKYNIPIIADGGIKQPSDIAKSLVLGAHMVMIGGMLSTCVDSPSELTTIQGKKYKKFYGSASNHSIGVDGKPKQKNIEGTLKLVECKEETLLEYYDYLRQCLQSAISYGGGVKVEDLQKVNYIIKS